MKNILKKGITTLSLVALVALATPLKAAEASSFNDPRMKGNGAGAITGITGGASGVEITATGSGVATHLGKFTRQEQITLNPETGTFTGSIVFTAANGDKLYCSLAGAFTSPNTAAGSYAFNGGTGRFANATGGAFFNITQSDPVNFSFSFAGSIEIH